MRLVLYYDDETKKEVTSQKEWEESPDEGVLFVVEPRSGQSPNLYHGRDYYLLRDDTLIAFDAVSLHGHLKLGVKRGSIKFGRWTTDAAYKAVKERMENDITSLL